MIETVARLASPTGQWPEAIHPHTGGGCMGDGQHGWAAAEWVMMIRNLFVREEGDRLIVGSGLFEEWFESDEDICFGPTLTPWGPVTVRIVRPAGEPTAFRRRPLARRCAASRCRGAGFCAIGGCQLQLGDSLAAR